MRAAVPSAPKGKATDPGLPRCHRQLGPPAVCKPAVCKPAVRRCHLLLPQPDSRPESPGDLLQVTHGQGQASWADGSRTACVRSWKQFPAAAAHAKRWAGGQSGTLAMRRPCWAEGEWPRSGVICHRERRGPSPERQAASTPSRPAPSALSPSLPQGRVSEVHGTPPWPPACPLCCGKCPLCRRLSAHGRLLGEARLQPRRMSTGGFSGSAHGRRQREKALAGGQPPDREWAAAAPQPLTHLLWSSGPRWPVCVEAEKCAPREVIYAVSHSVRPVDLRVSGPSQ